LAGLGSWDAQWAQVPAQWRRPVYPIYAAPYDQVFLRNQFYLRGNRATAEHDFTPTAPSRFTQEIAWWVWLCWDQQLRRIEPSLLAWLVRTLPGAVAEHQGRTGQSPVSIAELDPTELIRQAALAFQRRNNRLPSTGSRRNIRHLIEHLHLSVAVRCTDAPWWSHDIWDLRADPRIPQRPHEPHHDQTVRLRGIEPIWLREGLRFWLRSALTFELLTWSSVVARARNVGSQLGRFARDHGHLHDPLISTDPDELRAAFLDYLEYLRSPDAATQSERLTPYTVATLQSETQSFYTFMHDHAAEAAIGTGNPRWREATLTHTALWAPIHAPRHRRRERDLTWYSTADLQRMLTYLDVLAADPKQKVVLTRPDGTVTVLPGLGDPQAARVWLLQALTGRRASEILMLDYDPLEAIPGQDRPDDGAAEPDSGAFVVRLRYQQTKVDGVIPTILAEQAIVDIITEQQAWLAATYPCAATEIPISRDQESAPRPTPPLLHHLPGDARQARRLPRPHRQRRASPEVHPNPPVAPHPSHRTTQRRRSLPRRATLPRPQESRDDRPLRGHPRGHCRSRVPQTQEDRGARLRHRHHPA